jgi:hypothetical protein
MQLQNGIPAAVEGTHFVDRAHVIGLPDRSDPQGVITDHLCQDDGAIRIVEGSQIVSLHHAWPGVFLILHGPINGCWSVSEY